jgi:galactokinase
VSTTAQARELFVQRFGREPAVIASAPGRVNLIGEHTDYNGGEVLPIGITHRTVVAVGPARLGSRSAAVSAAQSHAGSFDMHAPQPAGAWWDYIAGVAAELTARGVELPEVNITVCSDVPSGAGLSSSAALEVASALALLALARREMAPMEIALLGARAESGFVGVASGIMDQCASALARAEHALYLRCDTVTAELVSMRDAVLIFDTGIARSLRDSPFNTRRAECEAALALLRRTDPALPNLAAATLEQLHAARLPAPLDRRARHVVSEMMRVRESVTALRNGGAIPGELLYASHESLRLDYECSIPELDWFVDRAMECEGVAGARLTGAGWGGCAIAVGTAEALHAVAPELARDYEARFGRAARVWITRAAAGARIDHPAHC